MMFSNINYTFLIFLLILLCMMITTSQAKIICRKTVGRVKTVTHYRRNNENQNRITGTGTDHNTNDEDDHFVDEDDDEDEDDDIDEDEDDEDDDEDEEEEEVTDDYASHPAGDDMISYDIDCDAIAAGTPISNSSLYDYQLIYQIDLALEIDGNTAETLQRLEDFLQSIIATDLTGCSGETTNATAVNLQYVLFDVTEDTDSDPYCSTCTNADVMTDVRYNSDVDDSVIEDAIYDAFIEHCNEMKEIDGIVDTFDPCPTIVIRPVNPDTGGVTTTQPPVIDDGGVPVPDDDTNSTDRGGVAPIISSSQESSNGNDLTGAGIFGIILAALIALMALIALLVRRRRTYGRRQLNKLDQNDTFMIDDGTTNNNGSASPGRFHDEDDSMLDSRYGMYPEGQTEGMILGAKNVNQDVHKCTSATCNLCEARRRNTIAFLPTKGTVGELPPITRVSSNTISTTKSMIPRTVTSKNATTNDNTNERMDTTKTTRAYTVDDTVII